MTKAQKQQQKKRRIRAAILIVIVLAVVTTVCVLALHKGYDHFSKTVYPLPYREYVEKYAAEYGEDPSLVYAVMSTESSFDAEAVSSAGAMGLMQLTDKTFEWAQMRMGTQDKGLTDDDLFKPEINIQYGTYVLHLLREECAGMVGKQRLFAGWRNAGGYSAQRNASICFESAANAGALSATV